MPLTTAPPSAIAPSVGNDWSIAPLPGEIEFTLFGPGFGECGLVHIGDGRWIVIDSCVRAGSGEPVALGYLRLLGVDPAEAVVCIIATHWHDDHVRGMGALVEACPKALFVCSAAMTSREFEGMVAAFDGQRMVRAGSGVTEVNRVFSCLIADTSRAAVRHANAGRLLWHGPKAAMGHGHAVTVTALSPSDRDQELSLKAIGKLMPRERDTQYRCPAEQPNLMSIATHIAIGSVHLLLGADLENDDDAERGWRAVLRDQTLPRDQAQAFKVAHHGGVSGDCDGVWQTLLDRSPLAVVSPWLRGGRRLPTEDDVARIVSRTEKAYLTAPTVVGQTPVGRPAAVERQLREMGARVTRLEPPMGAVRFRRQLEDGAAWVVDLSGHAARLQAAAA